MIRKYLSKKVWRIKSCISFAVTLGSAEVMTQCLSDKLKQKVTIWLGFSTVCRFRNPLGVLKCFSPRIMGNYGKCKHQPCNPQWGQSGKPGSLKITLCQQCRQFLAAIWCPSFCSLGPLILWALLIHLWYNENAQLI